MDTRRNQRGQSMVEMAFLMPIFLTMIFGIIEIARVMAARHALTQAAREGSRVLVLPSGAGLDYSSESQVMAAAEAAVRSYMNSSSVPVADSTKIFPVRVTPGNDHLYGTEDDVYEKGYSDAIRGDRVGMAVIHEFETPIAALLGMFDSKSVFPTSIRMSSTSFMSHE